MSNPPAATKRVCLRCQQEKPIEEFYRAKRRKGDSGVQSYCKSCSYRSKLHKCLSPECNNFTRANSFCKECRKTQTKPCGTPGCPSQVGINFIYCKDCRSKRRREQRRTLVKEACKNNGWSSTYYISPCTRCCFLTECRYLNATRSEIDPYCFVSSRYHHRFTQKYPTLQVASSEEITEVPVSPSMEIAF